MNLVVVIPQVYYIDIFDAKVGIHNCVAVSYFSGDVVLTTCGLTLFFPDFLIQKGANYDESFGAFSGNTV